VFYFDGAINFLAGAGFFLYAPDFAGPGFDFKDVGRHYWRKKLFNGGAGYFETSGSRDFGGVSGMLMGYSRRLKEALESLIFLIQAVPPILLMTLAMIWFGLDGRATVFIVFICGLPVMAVNVKEGFENIDPKLLEMGRMFKFSRRKMLTEIIIPSLSAYFKSGLIVVMGLGWKVAVMGEVLGSGSGLGSQISDARVNLETEKVFAWGIVVIILCYLSQKALALIFKKRGWSR
jgi:NitT/TauT family transport system permease protein